SAIYKIIPKRKKDVAREGITRAGSGLRRLIALRFANLGAILVLWDINKESSMKTNRLAKQKSGVEAFAYTCDCGNRQEVYRVAEQTCKTFLPAMFKANHDYSASKFAAYGLAESLFSELALTMKSNIKTTIVCPFFIKTGMFEGCAT
ncbi:Short-chain dehydrogenase/reductase family 16C member 6, partial [Galemys pyrenaicus]